MGISPGAYEIKTARNNNVRNIFNAKYNQITVYRELCTTKAKNINYEINKLGPDSRPCSCIRRAPGSLCRFHYAVLRWLGLPTASFRPSFPLGSRLGWAGQYIGMRAPEMTRGSFLIGSHYRDSQYHDIRCAECAKTSILPGIRHAVRAKTSYWRATCLYRALILICALYSLGY